MASQSTSAINGNMNKDIDDNNSKLKNDKDHRLGGFHERRPSFAPGFRKRVMEKRKKYGNWRHQTTSGTQQASLTPSNAPN